jgi:hypothetical protein
VAQGVEAAALWVGMAMLVRSLAVHAVAAYGAMEGAQRAGCRLALPMDRAPSLAPGQTLCDAATGLPMSLFSLMAAMVVIVVADTAKRPVLVWRP